MRLLQRISSLWCIWVLKDVLLGDVVHALTINAANSALLGHTWLGWTSSCRISSFAYLQGSSEGAGYRVLSRSRLHQQQGRGACAYGFASSGGCRGLRERARLLQSRMSGKGGDWMFINAKFQGRDQSGIPMSVLAPLFGDLVLVGQEKTLSLTRVPDQLLVRRAFEAESNVAYAVGVASTSRTSPNSQGFMAGTVASRLQILSAAEDKSRGTLECVCRAVGRVLIRNVDNMTPFVSATVTPVHDKTPASWARLEDVQDRVSKLFEECQQLYRTATERTLSTKLSKLESQGFILSLSEQDHLDLVRARNVSSNTPPSQAASISGVFGADQLFGGGDLTEDIDRVLAWQGPGAEDARLRRAEVHSFLTLRAGGLSNEELKVFMACDSVMDRSLMALERLEIQRDRLRAVASLSGLG